MFGSFVSAADYAHLNGAGGGMLANPAVMDELRKSLLSIDPAVGVSGAALIPQSLETVLKVTTHKMKELKLWQTLAKRPAFNTIEEYNVLNSYGLEENGFMDEGGLPNEDASEFVRETGLVKYMGTVRGVTHPATLVRTTIGSLIDQEDTSGTMHLLRLLETNLFYGDDRLNPKAFKGLKQILTSRGSENVIDLRGEPISAKVLESIDQRIADKFGEIDTLFMSTKAKANMSRLLMPKDGNRIVLPQGGTSTNLGMTVDRYDGNNSSFNLENHKFIRENTKPKTTIAAALNGLVGGTPAQPAVALFNPAAGTYNRLAAGTYSYVVSAVNDRGEGLGSVATANASPDGTNCVRVTITQVAGARFYRIYRNAETGQTTRYLVDEVKDSGGGTTLWEDRGVFIPGASMAFGLFLDPDQGMQFKQLAPLMKLPLAQINTTMRWAILLYGMLQVYQPKKCVLLINVGAKGMPSQPEAEPDPDLDAYFRAA
jgi:hypothetical protein